MMLLAIDWTPLELALSGAALAVIAAAVPLIKAWLNEQTAQINHHTTTTAAQPPAGTPPTQPPAAGGS